MNIRNTINIKSNFTDLDNEILGFHSGNLITFTGNKGVGLTSMVISLIRNIVIEQRIPAYYISLQDNHIQTINRLLSNLTEIDSERIAKGNLSIEEWEKITTAFDLLNNTPLTIHEPQGYSFIEIKANISQQVKTRGIKLVLVDSIDLIENTLDDKDANISDITKKLKLMAMELNIPVIVTIPAQLAQRIENASFPQYEFLDDVKYGNIEWHSDVVVGLFRPEQFCIYEDRNGNDTRGIAYAKILKHKMGPAGGELPLCFKKACGRLDNINNVETPDVKEGKEELTIPIIPEDEKPILEESFPINELVDYAMEIGDKNIANYFAMALLKSAIMKPQRQNWLDGANRITNYYKEQEQKQRDELLLKSMNENGVVVNKNEITNNFYKGSQNVERLNYQTNNYNQGQNG